MKFLYDLAGGQNDVQKVPVYQGGATPLKVGAAVMRGVTANTNQAAAIVAAGALADIIGVLMAASSATDFSEAGTANNLTKCLVNPFAVFLAEYSQVSGDLVTATSASSSTTLNCTSIENIAGGWVYVALGTDIGDLRYIVSGSSNVLTAKSAPATAWDTTTKFVKILPQFHELVAIMSDGTGLKSTAAAGTGAARVLANYMKYDGQDLVQLDATLHDATTGLNSLHAHFFAAIVFLDHALNVSA
jgi:hypothetical protein